MNPTPTLLYLFDPLCGWCYGAAPVLHRLAQRWPMALMPTGLFSGTGRRMDAALAQHAWQNDQRIASLTGQVFSPAYLQNVLQTQGEAAAGFDSQPLLLALMAVRQLAPARELETLAALQAARYVQGLDNTTAPVIAQVLQALGLASALPLQDASATHQALAQAIEQGQHCMARHGLQGVPQLIVAQDGRQTPLPNALLYAPESEAEAFITQTCQAANGTS